MAFQPQQYTMQPGMPPQPTQFQQQPNGFPGSQQGPPTVLKNGETPGGFPASQQSNGAALHGHQNGFSGQQPSSQNGYSGVSQPQPQSYSYTQPTPPGSSTFTPQPPQSSQPVGPLQPPNAAFASHFASTPTPAVQPLSPAVSQFGMPPGQAQKPQQGPNVSAQQAYSSAQPLPSFQPQGPSQTPMSPYAQQTLGNQPYQQSPMPGVPGKPQTSAGFQSSHGQPPQMLPPAAMSAPLLPNMGHQPQSTANTFQGGARVPQMGFPGGPGQGHVTPSGSSGFPPGPGAPQPPGNMQQAPLSFPSGPGFPSAPTGFPPGPGASQSQGYPPGPGAHQNQGYPPGPGVPPGPGSFPPGSFPPAPGGPPAPGMPGFPPGAPGAPGYPGPPQQRQQRLDPNMMPSAVQVMDDDKTREGLFPTGYPTAEAPPLVSTRVHAQDQGNCNPKFMRSTMYIAPQSSDILKASQLPFAISISPFAALDEKELSPPVIDLGPQGPVRCQRCKAYICPFMEFQDGGRRFRCPFCNASTAVEETYFAHLDHTGRRTDIDQRPELFLGAYEFVATKQYCKNGVPPKEPAFLFMIDVSYNAISSGMVPILCKNLEKILQALPKETNQSESSIRIGLATFDQVVHFFDLSSAQPKMLVMSDVQEPFVPLVDGLFLSYSEALVGLRAALTEIPRIFAPSRVTETVLQPVVQAGVDALKCADRAGKLFIFTTSIPSFEAPGKLKVKNERSLLGTDKEKTALVPQEESYTKLGENCVKNGVTVDLFLFPNAFIDVATIGQLSAVTGGSIFKYQYFSGEKDGGRFLTELQRHVSRQIGFDCMVRVRSSAGIRPISFYGSFFMENSTDLEIASIDESKAFFTELKHDDKLNDPSAAIQTACLYTSITGQRRLRILNLCLPVSADYNHLYRVADSDTLTTLFLKQAVQLNRDKGNKEMRENLAQRCAQLLATYREKCSETAPLGQLILPEALKLMPLYINSIIKNDAISGGSEMTVDDKVWQMELIRSLRVEDAMTLIYPRVYPVSDVQLNDPNELFVLPNQVRASVEYLESSKAYLIDNGVLLFLWIGLGVAEEWMRDVFGANNVAMLDPETHIIPERDNARSRALRRIVQLLPMSVRTRRTFIIVEKSSLEPWMKKFLVEDKASAASMSYVDFLCYIHREIRSILS